MCAAKVFFSVTGTIGLTFIIIYIILQSSQRLVKLNFTPLLSSEKYDLNLKLLQNNDYNSNLNIDFHFKIRNPICNKTEEEQPFLLILVHSSSDHFSKRQLIRNTWGKSSKNVKVAFLIGQSLKEIVNEELKVESFQNEDIIQGDFIDTYHNITYKHTMGMKYFIYHCSKVKYVLKVDDDMFVNTPKLVTFLSEEISLQGAKDVMMCATVVNARTLRSYRSKWRIGFDEYPHRYFPTFCRGLAIIYSPDVIFKLYNNAQRNKKYVKLDDVFYTGLTAQNVGYISHSNIDHLISFDYKKGDEDAFVPVNLNSYLFVGSEMSEKDILKLWNVLEKKENHFLEFR